MQSHLQLHKTTKKKKKKANHYIYLSVVTYYVFVNWLGRRGVFISIRFFFALRDESYKKM